MAPEQRRARALDRGLRLADRVARVAPTVWSVPSQSDPGAIYVVTLLDGALKCECPAALAGHPCGHTAAVALTLVAGPAVAA